MTDYYQPPTDHPNALEMERLQEQLNDLIKQRKALEIIESDFNDQLEIRYNDIEFQIISINNRLDSLYWENNRG